MTRPWNAPAIVFLILAVVGLIGTWTYNIQAIVQRTDFLGDWFANGPAVGSLTMDLLIMAVAACTVMLCSGARILKRRISKTMLAPRCRRRSP